MHFQNVPEDQTPVKSICATLGDVSPIIIDSDAEMLTPKKAQPTDFLLSCGQIKKRRNVTNINHLLAYKKFL